MKQSFAVRRRSAHPLTPQEKAELLADLRQRQQREVERDVRSLRIR